MAPRRPLNRKRIMRDFIIKELSAVDSPAQGGALAVLMKRDDDVEKDLSYASAPSIAALAIEAMDFNEVLAENQSREAAQRVKDCVWSKWSALQRSFETIAADEGVAPADKVKRMQGSLKQFLDAVGKESKTIAETITKSLSAVPTLSELLTDYDKGDDAMPDAEKRQLAELQKNVADLTAKLDAATAKDPAKKAADLTGELETAKAQLAEVTEKLTKADADRAEAEVLAKMSDGEKEYDSSLDKDGRAKFRAMSAEERKKAMKKSTDDNPVIYKSDRTGQEFRKADDPRLAAMAKDADEMAKRAAEEAEKRETAELNKRSDEEPYKSFSVEKDSAAGGSKVDVLRAISKMEAGPRAILEKWLEIGGKALSAAFEKIGHSHEQARKSSSDFSKRVNEIMARDKIGQLAALEKAQQEYPKEYDAFQESGAQLN